MASTKIRSKQQLEINDNLTLTNAYRVRDALDAVLPQDYVTLSQLQSVQQGLDVKNSVRAATTANITLSGTQTVDGVALSVGNRVLVKNQTTGSENGIWVVSAGAWSRATDADSNADVTGGMFTYVEEGTVNADSGWILTTNDPIVVGTTALTFTQFSGAGTYTAGSGLTLTGSQFSANTSGVTTGVVSNNIVVRSTSTQYQVLISTGSAGAEATWGAVNLASSAAVTGILPVANGGTGANTLAAYGVVVGNGTGAVHVTGAGTTGQYLKSGNGSANPVFATIASTEITNTSFVTSVSGTTNRITSTGGLTPVIDISAAYVGQTSITTLGTITTGTWNATVIGLAYGGTNNTQSGSGGNTAYTAYGIIYSDGTRFLSTSAGTAGYYLRSGGAGVAAAYAQIASSEINNSSFVTSVSGTANRITSTGGLTPVIDISASYVGQTSITTLGTIATGVWQGTVVATLYGGTGLSINPTSIADGDLLIGSNAGDAFVKATLTAGTNITITNAGGSITIAATGTLTTSNFVIREDPGETPDGVTTVFSLANTPTAGTEHVFVNGQLQTVGNDYTISGANITFLSGAIPQTGDIVRVSYMK